MSRTIMESGTNQCEPCTRCGSLILRNLFWMDNAPYHYGCAKNTEQFGRVVAICLTCFSHLTADSVMTAKVAGSEEHVCGYCGSFQLRFHKFRRGNHARRQQTEHTRRPFRRGTSASQGKIAIPHIISLTLAQVKTRILHGVPQRGVRIPTA